MSENENGHCAGTTKVAVKSHQEEKLEEATSENRHKGCGRDMLRLFQVSKYGQQQQGRPDRRRCTVVYESNLMLRFSSPHRLRGSAALL